MKERLISYDTAVIAKDKGFNTPVCNAYCGDNKNLLDLGKIWDYACMGGMELEEWFYDYNSYPDRLLVSAPTQSLLAKWLRDVHGIQLYALSNSTKGNGRNEHWHNYYWVVSNCNTGIRETADKYSFF
jgi:hypothetical protein